MFQQIWEYGSTHTGSSSSKKFHRLYSSLCETCKKVHAEDANRSRFEPRGWRNWPNVFLERERKGAGCWCCSLILSLVQQLVEPFNLQHFFLSVECNLSRDDVMELLVSGQWIQDREICAEFDNHFYIYNLQVDFHNLVVSSPQNPPPLPVDSKSDQCFAFLEKCLHECTSSHNLCKLSHKARLPKRVIRVGESNEKLKLCEIDTSVGAYATLSYCWGADVSFLKTTSKSLDEHKENILWSRLPRTIQDAIEVTRMLSLDYLWVDSLCIVQDSPIDWDTESSKMCEYYRNAHITIAASAESEAASGIFGHRRGLSMPKKMTFLIAGGYSCTCIAQERRKELGDTNSFVHHFGPLSQRAWAFQENLLSRRIIHYTSSELIWECCTVTISEDTSPVGNNRHKLFTTQLNGELTHPDILWRDLIENFTYKDLTLTSDRLPAIAGLAQLLQRQTGFHYIAGLWRETLLQDLLWCTDWHRRIIERPANFYDSVKYLNTSLLNGPSWSWGSILTGITFPKARSQNGLIPPEKSAKIDGANIQLKGANPFGQVTEGTLKVRGLLQKAFLITGTIFLQYNYNVFLPHREVNQQIQVQITPDVLIAALEWDGNIDTNELWKPVAERQSTGKELYGTCVLREPVWCLGICGSFGLVLKKSTSQPGAYIRIGLCDNVVPLLRDAATEQVVIV